ncbi:MAG: bifunctional 5,10-methylenetetrahydrofolate dehydrogenase/5,10-methenyltetrahydrofolate cyclohydrolase [Candidatus Omnitrophica bacterium]|nr:bifunctional 5,10-methylenetetrahydrofolate dehydrogenase/5,10-methenyltetrahydrofolate cyclohydrolase [Candidatus Omnitrophota bacterium]
MSAVILDGKRRADEVKKELSEKIKGYKASVGAVPKLVALEIGKDSAFSVYVKSQGKIAEAIGMEYELISLAPSTTEKELIERISSLNKDNSVTGIILQCPLPEKFDFIKVTSFISADKDVEGINPENKGKLLLNAYRVVPPTSSAAMELIELSGVDLYGKEAVVVGHSSIVGKPLTMLLLDRFATVTVCHIATSEKGKLIEHINRADIVAVAVGKPNLIKGEWIKEGAIVVDIGINSLDGKIVGDVEFESAKTRAGYISPVPGGVGPLTTAILMRNCLSLFEEQNVTAQ